jgi:hypothetical protein
MRQSEATGKPRRTPLLLCAAASAPLERPPQVVVLKDKSFAPSRLRGAEHPMADIEENPEAMTRNGIARNWPGSVMGNRAHTAP